MNQRRTSSSSENPLSTRGLGWLRAWTGQQEYRPRRAYFRPTDAASVDIRLVKYIEHVVTVRFVKIAKAPAGDGPRMFRIVGRGAPRQLRPEHEFDFLE